MAHKYVIFDVHTLTDKGVARNLAASANPGIPLNLNERPDLRFVSDVATI
jgi:hypothetical protein